MCDRTAFLYGTGVCVCLRQIIGGTVSMIVMPRGRFLHYKLFIFLKNANTARTENTAAYAAHHSTCSSDAA